MGRNRGIAVGFCVIICLSLVGAAFAGDPLGVERGKMKAILKQVSSEMEKKFYDPNMKGVDWKAATAEAEAKVENAKSVTEMLLAIHLLVKKLDDSHTAFVPPGRNVKYKFGFNAKPFGEDILVYSLKKNGAAERAGLKIGDRVVAINKFKPTWRNYDDMLYFHKVIRNAPALDMTIQRDGEAPFDLRLEAERKVEAAQLDMEREGDFTALLVELDQSTEWHYRQFDDGVGYAQIRNFRAEGENFMSGIIDASSPAKAIILDFRSNGGGSLDTLKKFAGMFEPEEKVLVDEVGRKKTEKLMVKPQRKRYTQPLVILVDRDTASAAEIFARYFQITKRAVLVGDNTAGAVTGAVMIPQQLGADSIVPYATYIGMYRLVMPDGRELEKNGVTPDVQCIPTQKQVAEEDDVCLAQAIQLARKAAGLPDKPAFRVKAIVDRD